MSVAAIISAWSCLRQRFAILRVVIHDRIQIARLSVGERECCHMREAAFDLRPGALASWRSEFSRLHREDKCRDCPAAAIAKAQEGGAK